MFGVPGGAIAWENAAQSGVESRMSRLTTPRNGSDMTDLLRRTGSFERRPQVRPQPHPAWMPPPRSPLVDEPPHPSPVSDRAVEGGRRCVAGLRTPERP